MFAGNNKFPGKAVLINGERAIVPTLSLKQARENKDALKRLTSEDVIDAADVMQKYVDALPLFTLALQRNYPEVKQEDLEDVLDYNLLKQIIPAILGAVPEGELVPASSTQS